MAHSLVILDPDDLRADGTETVLFSFTDSTGAVNAAVKDLGLTVITELSMGAPFEVASPEWTFSRYSRSRGGGGTLSSVPELTAMTWRQKLDATSYDNLATAVGYLGRLLAAGGVMKWVPDGSSNPRYIDFEPSPSPALLNGRAYSLFFATGSFDSPEGVDMLVWRQPYLRGAELDPTVNVLVNPTLLHDQDATANRPDSWAWDSTVGISAEDITDDGYQFTVSTGSGLLLAQSTGVGTAAVGETWTLSFYARSPDAGAKVFATLAYRDAGGGFLENFSSGIVTLTSAWQRITVTGTATNALVSLIRAFLRVDNDDATARTIQFRNVQLEEAASASLFRVGPGAVYPDPASTAADNGARCFFAWGHGDARTPARLFLNEGAGTFSRYVVARLSGGDQVAAWANLKHAQCEDFTMGTDTASAANANASGGNVARTTYATATLLRRATEALSAALSAVLSGKTWQVYARVANITAQPTTHTLQLKAGVNASLVSALDQVTYTSESTSEFDEVPLGLVYFPEDAAAYVELWSAQASGTGNLEWDCLIFVPATDLGVLTVAGGGTTSDHDVILEPEDGNAERGNVTAGVITNRYGVTSLDVEGCIPLWLEPGLNAVYVMGYTDPPTGTETHHGSALTVNPEVHLRSSPRWLT